MVGNAYNTTTGAGFNSATVSDNAGHTATTTATPNDPGLDDGYYILFLPPGDVVLNATYPGYGDAKTVNVVADSATRQNFNIAACSYSVLPANASFDALGGSGSIQLTAVGGCPWTVSNNMSWVTITSAGSGIGSSTANYTVSSNLGNSSRTGTIAIAGQSVAVTQSWGLGTLQGTVRSSATGNPISGATVTATGGYSTTTNSSGYYQITGMPSGSYSLTASANSYSTQTLTGVIVNKDNTTTQDLALVSIPVTVHGTVSDGSGHGWPLYAKITVTGTGYSNTIYTDPVTGNYSISLYQDALYTFSVNASGYNVMTRNITPQAGGSTENFVVTVGTTVPCTAPGYADLYSEPFERNNGGYTIVIPYGGPSSWAWGTPTNGPGNAHTGIDVWATNLSGNYANSEFDYLTSPNIDLSANSGQSSTLSWWQWLKIQSYDTASIEVSNNGGTTWTTVYSASGDVDLTWVKHSISLDSSYSVSNFRVRFHLSTGNNTALPGWYIDDVLIQQNSCRPLAGGLVIGNVYNANTGAGLTNAMVTDGANHTLNATATPNDAGLDDGFYTMFLPAGSKTLTASYFGYANDAKTLNVAADTVTRQNFNLNPLPVVTIHGTVTDGSGHGWPLYAKIDIAAPGYATTIFTDPVTGNYSINLYQGTQYSFTVAVSGYTTTRNITPPAGDSTENFAVTVDASYCAAPGYGLYAELFESSDGGYTVSGPATWSWGIPTSGPNKAHSGSRVWATNLAGNYNNNEDGYLISPYIDLSANAGQSLNLSWWQSLYICWENFSVDVSNDGGATWSTIYGPVTGSCVVDLSWKQNSVVLDPSYSVSNFRVRFHFKSDASSTYLGWYIDDVIVRSQNSCQLLPGGLVVGNVYDATTAAGLNNAMVTDGAGHTAIATATPNDPGLDDGFYSMFLPAGSVNLTASAAGHENGAATVNVAADSVIRQNFNLAACTSSVQPNVVPINASFDYSGGTGSIQVTAGCGYAWSVSTNLGWLAVTSGRSGTGSGTVNYAVSMNPYTTSRTGTFTIAGQTVTVTQASNYGTLQGTVRSSATGNPISGATVTATGGYSTTTDSSGFYRVLGITAGTHDISVSAYGYQPQAMTGVVVNKDITTTEDLSLVPRATATIQGTVTDGSGHGWPLYAKIDITAAGYTNTIYANPVTGNYSISLYEDISYTFTVSASGYVSITRTITPSSGGSTENYVLTVSTCTAPGYGGYDFETFEINGGDFAVSGTNTSWAWGVPTNGQGNAHSGSHVWSTNLAGIYRNSASDYLTSPNIDLSANAGQPLTLSWWQWLKPIGSARVDVSKDGGASWVTVYGPVSGTVDSTWKQHGVVLDPSYSVSNFRIRFSYIGTDNNSGYYQGTYGWHIDDVLVQTRFNSCQLLPGGLVVGNVYNAVTAAALNNATVADGAGHSATTAATPSDTGLDDGFYSLFLPAGSVALIASSPGYGESTTVNVVADTVQMFNFNVAQPGTLQGTVRSAATGNPISGATVTATGGYSTTTNSSGFYQLTGLPRGALNVTALPYGYQPQTVTGVIINAGAATTQDFAHDTSSAVTLQGTVTDSSGHGWPLYAKIAITAPGYSTTIYTDPATGHYSVNLYQGTPYSVAVSASGYNSTTRNITLPGESTENFALTVDAVSCAAPGYSGLYLENFESNNGVFIADSVTDPRFPKWSWGTPAGGPGSAHSGSKAWGTNTYSSGYLTSPNINLSAHAGQSSTLSWWQWYSPEYYARVEVSNNGGASWSVVYTPVSDSTWTRQNVLLDSSYSVSNFRVRFYFQTLNYGNWYIDDVSIQTQNSCQPLPGGLLAGNIYGAGAALNNATVTDGAGHTATATATPNDPGLDDGYYSVFLPAGDRNLTASYVGYVNDSKTVSVVADSVARQNFNLALCSYALLPTNASFTASGGAGSVQVNADCSGYAWTTSNIPSWVTITSGSSGTGSGTVNYTVSANTGTSPRTGTMTIAGQTFTVTQASNYGTLQGTVINSATGNPIGGATVTASGAYTTTTDGSGFYQFARVAAGTHDVTASAAGETSQTVTGVAISSDTTTTQNFALTPLPVVTIQGSVTDGSGHGWPLYAQIAITATGYSNTTYTDPVTGHYSVNLYQGTLYTFTVNVSGYNTTSRNITPPAGGSTENFALTVSSCTSMGYADAYDEPFDSTDGGYTVSGTTTWAWGTPTTGPGTAHSGSRMWATNPAGNYNNDEDGYLTSPNIDLSAYAGQPSTLSWWQWLQSESGPDFAGVEVSNDGGASWSAVYGPVSGNVDSTWTRYGVALDSSYSVSNFRVRFHFTSNSAVTGPGWYIDDVSVQLNNCRILSGGLVVGNVYDQVTGSGLNNATVTDGAGHSATTTATPNDPMVNDGFYSLFLPSGGVTISASFTGKGNDSKTVDVVADSVIRQDFIPSCASYTIYPVAASFNAAGGTGSIQVTATSSCPWVVNDTPSWVTITSGSSGTGNGTVNYAVSVNSATSSRAGSMTIAGNIFTVTQASNYGTLQGTVTSSATGNPISGATVTATGGYSTTTNSSGFYQIPNITVGAHDVTASAINYQSQTVNGVVVSSDVSTTQDFALNRLPLAIGTASLPAGTINTAYNQTLAATGGLPPYTWTITAGALPTGLSLDSATGVINGNPTTTGTANFTVQVTDANTTTNSRPLTIAIYNPLTITTATLPFAITGTAYDQTLSAADGLAPYTWAITTGALPAGLALNAASGVISGIPTATGTFNFTVKATDANASFTSKSLTIAVYAPLEVSAASLSIGTVGTAYSQTLAATGGLAPYSWSIIAGAVPAGLSLNGATGVISGNPTTAGTANFTVQVTDANTTTNSRPLTISVYNTITITTATLPFAVTGAAYNQTLSAAGGLAPYTWSITTGALPAGLTLNASTGAISGTPTATGTFNFTVKATDANASFATKSLTIGVYAPLAVSTASLSTGTVGTAYSQTLAATGGLAPYSWSITSGSLPAGLSFDGSGMISGTPTAAGAFSFTVQATDANAMTASKPLTLNVNNTLSDPILFQDDFSSGNLSGWSFVGQPNGTFNIATVNGNNVLAASGGGCASGVAVSTDNYSIDADLYIYDGSYWAYQVGIMLGASALSPSSNGMDGYFFTARPGYFELMKFTNGANWQDLGHSGSGLSPGTWNHLKVDVKGTNVKCYANNILIFDTNLNGLHGGAGFFIYGVGAYFDNFIVRNTDLTPPPLSITTATLPNATSDLTYSQTLTATGGLAPYTWSITTGALPAGLTLNASTGVISGTPTATGTFNFTVKATDANTTFVTKPLTVSVYAPLAISTASLQAATVNTAYSQTLSATGGLSPYTWAITAGALPAGLSLDSATGTITGTPTTSGSTTFTVQVTDANTTTNTKPLTINIYDPVSIATATLPFAVTGALYNQTLSATGGLAPYTWAITTGALPAGLILNTSSGVISGTPTATGTFNFTVKATDVNASFTTKSLTLDVYAPLVVGTASMPNGTVGTAYSQTLAATGGLAPYSWSITAGALPAGLSLDSATGVISGNPTTVGTANFTVQVTDANTTTTSRPLTISVYNTIAITSATLPNATFGVAYSQSLTATGGLPPYSWAITSGSLPPGLTLNSLTGQVSGSPTAIGDYSFTVKVTDGADVTKTGPISLAVKLPPGTVIQVPEALPTYYSLLWDAYYSLLDIGHGEVHLRGVDITENIDFNQSITVVLKGGYDDYFLQNNNYTYLHGNITITSGTVVIENLILLP